MGLLRDLFTLGKGVRELKARTRGMPGTSLGDAIRVGVDAVGTANEVLGQEAEIERLRAEGVAAQATVLAARDLQTLINQQPVFEFELEVQDPAGSPFVATTRQLIPRMLMGRFVPGSTVGVHFDRETGKVLLTSAGTVEWGASPPP